MRSRNPHDLLFAQATLSDALRQQLSAVPQRVQAVAESVLRAVGNETIVDQLAEEMKVAPLRLDLAGQTMRREEVEIDVTDDPRRFGFPDGRRIVVPGVRVTVSIPFTGERELWKLQPSTYRLSAPQGVVRTSGGKDGGVIELVIEQPSDEPLEKIKAERDRRLADFDYFIGNQTSDLAGFDSKLRQATGDALDARRARVKKHDGLAELLGIPEAASSVPASPGLPARDAASSASTEATDDEWDVFVSHASEDKESFVRPLVAALRAAGLRVWYDEHELRVGDSLRRTIDRGLARSRYGIVVISRHFLSKHWPQKELDGLVSREEENVKVVLPIWHEITPAEIRRVSPTLADRMAVNSARGVEVVTKELLRVIRPE